MPVRCQQVTSLIEKFAPKRLAEDWDNVGLQVGDPAQDIYGVMVALDASQEVLDEALAKGANLIVTHHPFVFKPMKSIRADLPTGRLMINMIKNNVCVYSAHTNLDSAAEGVNQVLAELLELQEIEVLNPDKLEKLYKIVVFVPAEHLDQVREAVTKSGAGWSGNYSDCTFAVSGTGTFMPLQGANPHIGKVGTLERVAEIRLETIIRESQLNRTIKAMLKAHPYEEVAYDIYPLTNGEIRLGLGRVGLLPKSMSLSEFMDKVKQVLGLTTVRFGGNPAKSVAKVALCGGSGAGFIHKASFAGADVFLTGDLKYHEAQEALSRGLSFVDAGHFGTENPVIAKLADWLTRSLNQEGLTVPVYVSQKTSDVFNYY